MKYYRKKKLNKVGKSTIIRLLSYMSQYKLQLIVVGVCLFAESILKVRATYYLKPAIEEYIVPFVGKSELDMSGFKSLMIIMGACYLGSVVALYIVNSLMIKISTNITCQIRNEMFEKLVKLPLSYHKATNTGRTMNYFTNDVDSLNETLKKTLPVIISSIVMLISIFVTIFTTDVKLALVFIACLLGVGFLLTKLSGNKSKYFVEQQRYTAELNAYSEEMISGKEMVNCYNKEEKVGDRFKEMSHPLGKSSKMAEFFSGSMFDMTRGLTYIGYTILTLIGCVMMITGKTTVGTVGIFLTYYKTSISPVTRISKQASNVMFSMAGAERVFDFLDTEEEIDEGKITYEGDNWRLEDGSLVPARGDIEFKHVDFGYTPKKQILKDFSLQVGAGKRYAFVGATGSGKTTIMNLLSRFYEADAGEITVDGINIKDIKLRDLRTSMSMVLQDAHFFTETVSNNIKYGKLDGTDEEVKAAAKLASADYFIEHLSNGYETVIDGSGKGMSLGEKQMLSLSRIAITDNPMFILDEATSSLDSRSELLIDSAMREMMKNRTVLLIAHRLSTIIDADCINVIAGGKIAESGTHEELVALKGAYYNLYKNR